MNNDCNNQKMQQTNTYIHTCTRIDLLNNKSNICIYNNKIIIFVVNNCKTIVMVICMSVHTHVCMYVLMYTH